MRTIIVLMMTMLSSPVAATTYNVSFFEESGATWGGSFEAPRPSEATPDYFYTLLDDSPTMSVRVISFQATIAGTTYDIANPDFSDPIGNEAVGTYNLTWHTIPLGFYMAGLPSSPDSVVPGLLIEAGQWFADGDCYVGGCSWTPDTRHGTYMVSEVPLPPALLLFTSGLAGLVLRHYGRKKVGGAFNLLHHSKR